MIRNPPAVITNTRPEQIVDKNGVLTTRHKKIDTGSTGKRISSAPSPSLATSRPLMNHSPAEVDVPLSENYFQQSRVFSTINGIENSIENLNEMIDSEIAKDKRTFDRLTAEGADEERLALFNRTDGGYYAKGYRERIEKFEKMLPDLHDELEELQDAALVYQNEFNARGGWSRFYQVMNSNGHVHRSTGCSTCFPTTQFHWHAERSGLSDDEIVDLAGSDACTVCFSDAPVEKFNQPGQLETPDMTTKREEREAREKKRAAKAASDLAKSITTPSGLPLRTNHGLIKTESAAEQEAVSAILWLYERGAPREDNPFTEKYYKDAQQIFEALLAKRGGSREDQAELIRSKAVAKLKREWKEAIPTFEAAFDPEIFS